MVARRNRLLRLLPRRGWGGGPPLGLSRRGLLPRHIAALVPARGFRLGSAMDWVFAEEPSSPEPLRQALRAAYRWDEAAAVANILAVAEMPADANRRIAEAARGLVAEARRSRHGKG